MTKMKTPYFVLSVVAVLFTQIFLTAPVFSQQVASKGEFIGAKTATHPDWFKESFLDFADDIEEAAAEGKRLVLYFWQPGCPYCNQLWEHNMAVDDIEKLFKGNFDVVALNMWGDKEVVTVAGKSYTEKQMAEALDVNFTPTLIFYNEDKKPALRINGYYPPRKFRQALQYVKEKREQQMSFTEYVKAQRPESGGALISEPFFLSPPYDIDRSKTPATKPLTILFETPGCAACEVLHNTTLKHDTTRKLLASMDVIQLDPTDQRSIIKPDGESVRIADWVKQLNLSYFPSALFFDEQGKQVMRMDAAFRNFHTQSIFAYVLEKAYLTEPNFQRYISARAEHLQEQGIDVDIWEE